METDAQGNRYYDADEARQVLSMGRSTFDRTIADLKVRKYRRDHDRKHYYRVEDIESLKNRPKQFKPIDSDKELAATR